MGLTTTVIYGGISQARQEKALRAGVDIVIACPGRLEDLIRQRILTLEAVEITVLDEADHMADLGFLPVVKKLMDMTPSQGQRLLFSATLDNGVDKIVQRYLSNPLTHSVDDPQAAVTTMEHHVLVVNDQTVKKQLIVELASGAGRRVLFMRTKHHARKLAKTLTDAGIPAVDLHGNLSQNARDRNLAEFSSGDVRVLVATDVAARGVHVDDVELVIHVDPPTEHKAYLHRSGRTARAGSDGTVVTLTLPEQQSDVKKLMKAAGVEVNFERVTANSPLVAELVGEMADKIDPRTRAALLAAKAAQQAAAAPPVPTPSASAPAAPPRLHPPRVAVAAVADADASAPRLPAPICRAPSAAPWPMKARLLPATPQSASRRRTRTGRTPSAPSAGMRAAAAAPPPTRTTTMFRQPAAVPRPAAVRTDAPPKDAATPGALRLPAAAHPASVAHPATGGAPRTGGLDRRPAQRTSGNRPACSCRRQVRQAARPVAMRLSGPPTPAAPRADPTPAAATAAPAKAVRPAAAPAARRLRPRTNAAAANPRFPLHNLASSVRQPAVVAPASGRRVSVAAVRKRSGSLKHAVKNRPYQPRARHSSRCGRSAPRVVGLP